MISFTYVKIAEYKKKEKIKHLLENKVGHFLCKKNNIEYRLFLSILYKFW